MNLLFDSLKQCCGFGSGRIRIIWPNPDPDPDPHRDGENGSGKDPGSIKGSQHKEDQEYFFYEFNPDPHHVDADPQHCTEVW